MAQRLVVIGGDAGGMAAASQARRQQPDLEIVALEKSPWTSYSACGIPYLVGGDIDSIDRLIARSPQEFRTNHRIDARVNHEVMGIDLQARSLEVRDHEHDRTYKLGFDILHLGLGAVPIRPPLPGMDTAHVHGVQTLADAAELLEDVTTGSEVGHRLAALRNARSRGIRKRERTSCQNLSSGSAGVGGSGAAVSPRSAGFGWLS